MFTFTPRSGGVDLFLGSVFLRLHQNLLKDLLNLHLLDSSQSSLSSYVENNRRPDVALRDVMSRPKARGLWQTLQFRQELFECSGTFVLGLRPRPKATCPHNPVATVGILAALRRLLEDSDFIEIPSHKDVT